MAKHELEKLYKKYQKIKQYADGGEVENVDFTDPTVIKALRPQQPISDIEEKSLDSDLIEKPYSDEELKAKAESDNKNDNEDETDDSEDDIDTSDDSKDQPKPTEEPDGKLEVGSTITEPPKDKSDIASLIASLKSSPGPSDLQKAQADRDQELNLNQIQRGAAFIGSGLAKTNPDRILKDIKENDRSTLPMEKYNETIANQQYDPNSDMSVGLRDYLKSKKIPVPENASAADIKTFMPNIIHDQQYQALVQKATISAEAKLKAAIVTQTGLDTRADKANQTRLDSANILAKARTTGSSKTDERTNKRLALSASKSIETDPTVKKANDRINSTGTALSQLQDKSQPLSINRLNAIQIDLANTLNFMAQTGASDYKAKSDKLETLKTKIAGLRQPWQSSILDLRTEAPEVYKEVIKYAQSVHDSVSKIKQNQINTLSNHYGDALGGDVGDRIKNIYKNQESKPESSPQDQQALQHYQTMDQNDPQKASLGAILKSKGLL